MSKSIILSIVLSVWNVVLVAGGGQLDVSGGGGPKEIRLEEVNPKLGAIFPEALKNIEKANIEIFVNDDGRQYRFLQNGKTVTFAPTGIAYFESAVISRNGKYLIFSARRDIPRKSLIIFRVELNLGGMPGPIAEIQEVTARSGFGNVSPNCEVIPSKVCSISDDGDRLLMHSLFVFKSATEAQTKLGAWTPLLTEIGDSEEKPGKMQLPGGQEVRGGAESLSELWEKHFESIRLGRIPRDSIFVESQHLQLLGLRTELRLKERGIQIRYKEQEWLKVIKGEETSMWLLQNQESDPAISSNGMQIAFLDVEGTLFVIEELTLRVYPKSGKSVNLLWCLSLA